MSVIKEELLKTDKHEVKVSFFRGTTIEDMEENVESILQREPGCIILYVGTKNTMNLTARYILEKLLLNNSGCS